MSDIQKQVALVTGSSRGIGRAIAERLSKDGYTVVVNYSGDTASAEDVVKSIKDKGGNAIAIQANVANENDVARMFSEAKLLTGKIDVVVHSAGVMPLTKIIPTGLADFDKVINI
ncbi:SDR family NAD(P)-dependent oxidoreductase [Providencia sp. R33]|uniref:SDR family NAD(P)-dependent oxidoreductase n=1 Tax=Providencia sp. R33 TaxID=2828763 RepID=UPI001C5A85F5|nr:SDR family NAD(P)-dependent oxidoreductase [Providencia sp. R33]QXX82812.1 SDR family NAD(P)-dependent oxidoreductase [Providencia sp. R33]